MRQSIVLTALAGVLIFAGAGIGTAQATTITGTLWHVSEAISQDATPLNVASILSTTPNVTFDVTTPMSFGGTGLSVADWLATGSASNVTSHNGFVATSLMDDGNIGTLINFTGFVSMTSGQSISSIHDDGLTLFIDGINQGFDPSPTAPTLTTLPYNGTSGEKPFQLVYGECCQGPAVLTLNLQLSNTRSVSLPEPASLLLLSFGLLGLAVWQWKRAA